jgi:hypothetical protein
MFTSWASCWFGECVIPSCFLLNVTAKFQDGMNWWSRNFSPAGPSRSSLPPEYSPMSCNLHTALSYPSSSSGIVSGVPEKCFTCTVWIPGEGSPEDPSHDVSIWFSNWF